MASMYLYIPDVDLNIAVVNNAASGDDAVLRAISNRIEARTVEALAGYGRPPRLVLNWAAITSVVVTDGDTDSARFHAEATVTDAGLVRLEVQDHEADAAD
ncbi:hypothetical protein ACLQ3K_16080 [Tsukamurella sp. DT100]|uniref:hypothetical protein n=1 Tax=Tsukamurella sp. DT100 TaxID=3393415 RepID=UPI003CE73F62